jgi:hypothetical protein
VSLRRCAPCHRGTDADFPVTGRTDGGRQAVRETVPRAAHGVWKKPAGRADPIETLQKSDADRMPELGAGTLRADAGFLAWLDGENGRQFYARQLRDAKIKPLVETFDAMDLLVGTRRTHDGS